MFDHIKDVIYLFVKKYKSLRKRRKVNRIFLITIFLVFLLGILNCHSKEYNTPHKSYRCKLNQNLERKLINENDFKAPAYNASQSDDAIHRNFPTNNVPFAHVGYLRQNGPLMVNRTLARQQNRVEIVFDTSLQDEFPELYTNIDQDSSYCPLNPECHFTFTNNYDLIAEFADSLVSKLFS